MHTLLLGFALLFGFAAWLCFVELRFIAACVGFGVTFPEPTLTMANFHPNKFSAKMKMKRNIKNLAAKSLF